MNIDMVKMGDFSDNQRAIDEYSISSECLKKLDYYTTKFLL